MSWYLITGTTCKRYPYLSLCDGRIDWCKFARNRQILLAIRE